MHLGSLRHEHLALPLRHGLPSSIHLRLALGDERMELLLGLWAVADGLLHVGARVDACPCRQHEAAGGIVGAADGVVASLRIPQRRVGPLDAVHKVAAARRLARGNRGLGSGHGLGCGLGVVTQACHHLRRGFLGAHRLLVLLRNDQRLLGVVDGALGEGVLHLAFAVPRLQRSELCAGGGERGNGVDHDALLANRHGPSRARHAVSALRNVGTELAGLLGAPDVGMGVRGVDALASGVHPRSGFVLRCAQHVVPRLQFRQLLLQLLQLLARDLHAGSFAAFQRLCGTGHAVWHRLHRLPHVVHQLRRGVLAAEVVAGTLGGLDALVGDVDGLAGLVVGLAGLLVRLFQACQLGRHGTKLRHHVHHQSLLASSHGVRSVSQRRLRAVELCLQLRGGFFIHLLGTRVVNSLLDGRAGGLDLSPSSLHQASGLVIRRLHGVVALLRRHETLLEVLGTQSEGEEHALPGRQRALLDQGGSGLHFFCCSGG